MKLYGYFRSSAAYRARIALNLKGLKYEYVAVNLAKDEAEGNEYAASIRRRSCPRSRTTVWATAS